MNKPIRKVRAGQPISEGTTSAQTILRSVPMTSEPMALHRVDAGKYEHRPLPIDVAKPDSETGYDLKGKTYPDDDGRPLSIRENLSIAAIGLTVLAVIVGLIIAVAAFRG